MAPPLTLSFARSIAGPADSKHLDGEGFVELHQIDLLERNREAGEQLADGGHWPDAEALRLDACGRVADESARADASRRPWLAFRRMTITAAAPSLVCEEFPAVTVPFA